jgi:hypothetical protein
VASIPALTGPLSDWAPQPTLRSPGEGRCVLERVASSRNALEEASTHVFPLPLSALSNSTARSEVSWSESASTLPALEAATTLREAAVTLPDPLEEMGLQLMSRYARGEWRDATELSAQFDKAFGPWPAYEVWWPLINCINHVEGITTNNRLLVGIFINFVTDGGLAGVLHNNLLTDQKALEDFVSAFGAMDRASPESPPSAGRTQPSVDAHWSVAAEQTTHHSSGLKDYLAALGSLVSCMKARTQTAFQRLLAVVTAVETVCGWPNYRVRSNLEDNSNHLTFVQVSTVRWQPEAVDRWAAAGYRTNWWLTSEQAISAPSDWQRYWLAVTELPSHELHTGGGGTLLAVVCYLMWWAASEAGSNAVHEAEKSLIAAQHVVQRVEGGGRQAAEGPPPSKKRKLGSYDTAGDFGSQSA